MKTDEAVPSQSQTTQLVLQEGCFLQAQAGRLSVETEGRGAKQLEPFEMVILQSGTHQLKYLDTKSGGKIWPRSAKTVEAIQRLDHRHFGMLIEIPGCKHK